MTTDFFFLLFIANDMRHGGNVGNRIVEFTGKMLSITSFARFRAADYKNKIFHELAKTNLENCKDPEKIHLLSRRSQFILAQDRDDVRFGTVSVRLSRPSLKVEPTS
jgi:hypothetical protein